jgi:DNA-directed RNA polymerase subunit E'/Rpb7
MPIIPFDFNRDLRQVLMELINEKYANRVVADVGLVISLYAIDSIGDGHLVPDNGCSYTDVTFRLIHHDTDHHHHHHQKCTTTFLGGGNVFLLGSCERRH